ncbi:Protein rarD [Desulfamplus magnetovallimortis]|uniref:Protein rarD n=1 Tax=Desulfamplus magnetovallimortis TaxID=1246637 RepID=A0A1W1H8B4_9BACT|nr:EamA family transporter RarD [Desulfamplus magnetovallimortis]SLM28730.1 Protein rarD [Desulfamplus magnetovallimortis]
MNRAKTQIECQESSETAGILFLVPAFFIWGISPIYWKALSHVSSTELLFQRVIWSFVVLFAIVVWQGKFHEIKTILKSFNTMVSLLGSTIVLALNWYLFIWAVNHDQVLQTSLGYYINPLIMVFLGMIFLGERLRIMQTAALFVAGSAVLYYAVGLGEFPWIALSIALSFGVYGLFHKMTSISSLTGLCMETMILSVPALVFVIVGQMDGTSALFHFNLRTDLLLMGTNLVTALPLLLFTIGTRKSTMATVGFMQYLAPSITFVLAVLIYNEPFSHKKLLTFIMIWIALFLYTVDSVQTFRKRKRGMAVLKRGNV